MQVVNTNPHVTVTGRHLAITAAINDYAEKKIESLHLDYPRIIEAHVILEVDKYRHRAEVVLVCCNHITIEASEESTDLYASMDMVIAKIARQMRKYKTRLLRSHRPRKNNSVRYLDEQVFSSGSFAELDEAPASNRHSDRASVAPAAAPAEAHGSNGVTATTAAAVAVHPEPQAVQTEQYPVKPMYVDEAILQLQMSERPFVVFMDAKTEKASVLYRRDSGDYGLIQPADA